MMVPRMPAQPPLVLIVRDGWGKNPNPDHDRFNAVKLAETPIADRLMREYPATLIRTSGEAVGLPAGVMGNSEVGHQNIGAGRIVDQELMRISGAIRSGAFAENPALNAAFDHAADTGGRVHLLGLVSDGKVHSDLGHLFALIDLAVARGVAPVLCDRPQVEHSARALQSVDLAPRGGGDLGLVDHPLGQLQEVFQAPLPLAHKQRDEV